MSATRIFHNGKVYTVNKNRDWAEAVAIEGNKIIYVGTNEEALKLADDNTVITDLEGKMMMPGFIDGHIHPLMAAAFASGAQLGQCQSHEEILATVKAYVEAHPDNETYFGQGFSEAIYADRAPLASELDEICADKPMLLVSSSCHGAWCNHKAFEVAGIDKDTPDITPGSNYFVRDEEGNPTGRCIESCYIQVAKGADYFPADVLKENLSNLSKEFAALGYTSFADCGVFSFVVDSLDEEFVKYFNDGEFSQRLFGGFYLATNIHDILEALVGAAEIAGNLLNTDRASFRYFKILGDGVIEAKSAAMVQPYDNGVQAQPNFSSVEAKIVGLLVAYFGYDLYMHAIGDATTKVALDMAEAIRESGFDDTRIAIAHSQCFQPGQIERAGKLNVFINSTGSWHYFSTDNYKKYIGANIVGHQYPIRSLIDAGCKYGQGSDFPVADGKPSPFESIQIGMTRRHMSADPSDPNSYCDREEGITLEESIDSFTINNAWEVRMEDKLGSIEEGKYADLVVLDQNLFDVPVDDIYKTNIVETICDGVTTYKA